MTDAERMLAHLREHGSITSYEARILYLSANPSERVRDLQAAGHEIEIEHFHREVHGKKRPCARYTLIGANVTGIPESQQPGDVRSAQADMEALTGSSEEGQAPISNEMVCGDRECLPLQLFDVAERKWADAA